MKRIYRLFRLLWDVWQTVSQRNVGLIAAGVAFFGMFAIFPAISAVIAVFGLLADPAIVLSELELLEDVIPQEAYVILVDQTSRLLATRGDALGVATLISFFLALWAARAGVAALMGGLNAIADRPARNGIKQAIVALALTLGLVGLAITALLAVVILPIVLAFIPLQVATASLLEVLRWVTALVSVYAALALLYRFGPNQRGARIRWMTIGAVFVTLFWILASVGLSFYLANFAGYNQVYGSIGAVIAMLLWLYMTAYLVLLGAALNLHVHGTVSGPDSNQSESGKNSP